MRRCHVPACWNEYLDRPTLLLKKKKQSVAFLKHNLGSHLTAPRPADAPVRRHGRRRRVPDSHQATTAAKPVRWRACSCCDPQLGRRAAAAVGRRGARWRGRANNHGKRQEHSTRGPRRSRHAEEGAAAARVGVAVHTPTRRCGAVHDVRRGGRNGVRGSGSIGILHAGCCHRRGGAHGGRLARVPRLAVGGARPPSRRNEAGGAGRWPPGR